MMQQPSAISSGTFDIGGDLMMPIPATSRVAHLVEQVAAVRLRLSDDDFSALDAAVAAAWAREAGGRA